MWYAAVASVPKSNSRALNGKLASEELIPSPKFGILTAMSCRVIVKSLGRASDGEVRVLAIAPIIASASSVRLIAVAMPTPTIPRFGTIQTPSPNPTVSRILSAFVLTLTYMGVRVSPAPCNARAPIKPVIRIGAATKMIVR